MLERLKQEVLEANLQLPNIGLLRLRGEMSAGLTVVRAW